MLPSRPRTVRSSTIKLLSSSSPSLQGIEVMRDIPELEPQILTNMFWPEKPNLAVPDKNDINVKARRVQLELALKTSLAPLESYLKTLDPLQVGAKMKIKVNMY